MTFLEIKQRIAEQLGISSADTTTDANATIAAKLTEWVNARYRVLAGKRSWNWLIKDSIVQTVVDVTTGTVTATLGSANITFSTGPTLSAAGWFIQFSDSNDWYEISTHTAAATAAVMTVPYLGTTSSTLTYVLRKVYYALPTDTNKILNISQHRVWNTTLQYIPARILDQYESLRNSIGRPRFYSISGVDSSRQYKMELFPTPDVAMNLNVRRYCIVAELSADGDVPVIPEAFHDILVWDVLSTYGFTWLDDTRISSAKAEFNNLYDDLVKNDVATEDIPVRMPFDMNLTGTSEILDNYDLPII